MSVKMECDNCHMQVTTEGVGNHGWIIVAQQLMFQQLGETPINGSFCTVSCAIEWLKKKEVTADVELPSKEDYLARAEKDRVTGPSHPSDFSHGSAGDFDQLDRVLLQFSGKAGEILRKVWGSGEPIAVFRARDLLSIFVLQAYAEALERYGAHYDQQESWGQVRDDFRTWQNAHASQVRLPD